MAWRGRRTSLRNRRSAPRRPPVQSQLRTLARAVTFEPCRLAIPADPPSVPRTFTFNTIISCRVEVAERTVLVPVPSKDMDNPLIGCGFEAEDPSTVYTCVFTLKEVYKAWCHWMRFSPNKNDSMEICLTKVQFWGMSPNAYSGIEIGLNLQPPIPFSSQSVRDAGTTSARPRCGISMPTNNWEDVSSAATSIGVDPDTMGVLSNIVPKDLLVVGFNLGVVHLSVSVRVSMCS